MLFFFLVWVCMCVFVHICTCTWMSNAFLDCSPPSIWRQIFSMNLELPSPTSLTSQRAREMVCLSPYHVGISDGPLTHPLFTDVLGIQTPVLYGKILTWFISLALVSSTFENLELLLFMTATGTLFTYEAALSQRYQCSNDFCSTEATHILAFPSTLHHLI